MNPNLIPAIVCLVQIALYLVLYETGLSIGKEYYALRPNLHWGLLAITAFWLFIALSIIANTLLYFYKTKTIQFFLFAFAIHMAYTLKGLDETPYRTLCLYGCAGVAFFLPIILVKFIPRFNGAHL